VALRANAVQTLDGGDWATSLGNARRRFRQGLDGNDHVMGICMNQHHAVRHDANVPAPKHKVSAPKLIEVLGYRHV
jgi:hypothetical protein